MRPQELGGDVCHHPPGRAGASQERGLAMLQCHGLPPHPQSGDPAAAMSPQRTIWFK